MKTRIIPVLLMLSFILPLSAQTTKDKTEIDDEKNSEETVPSTLTPNVQIAMSAPFYPVTAGDIYTLSFYNGGNAVKYTIPVDSNYKIRVANLGIINCAGLTYLQLKSQVETLVVKNFPMSGVQFVLMSPAVFTVTVTGEVNSTQEYYVWALTRLSEIYKRNLTDYSSKRSVVIENSNGKSKSYDLFLAERNGDLSQDPYLCPGDIIKIGRYERQVSVSGAVERPGTYELLPGENLKELIQKYGNGLTPLADTSRTELYRKIVDTDGAGEKIYLNQQNINNNFELLCYDSISVSSFSDLQPVVFIEGAISSGNSSSGSSSLGNTTKLASRFINGEDYAFFVRRNQEWFSPESDLERAYILRGTEVIPLDLNKSLYDISYYSNIQVADRDTLVVPFRQFFVSVAGAVIHPGRFPYIPDRKWDYYVGLAGGFIDSQNTGDSVTIRDVNGKKITKKDIITPETTITANTNSGLYYFNQYAPIITTILTAVGTTLSILTVTGVIGK